MPSVEPVIVFDSPTLAEVITRVNKHSNNVMARHLLYTLSAEVLGAPGTEAGGRKVVGDWLVDNDLELATLAFENGAGLSRDARISARDFGAMLKFAWQQPYMPEFVASMPISGMDGTLRRKFGSKPLLGRAHLKTGTLDHVAAIAGYLQARSGRRFSVVALHNHKDVHRGTGAEVQDALLRWLYEQ
jgi:D-alanyl-D-alanine carboxypeptidase/D-alanyl-D-alanine-endopeptidase (penicillin-binding protein 4)